MLHKAQKFWDKRAKKYDKFEKQFEPVLREIIAKTKQYLDPDDTVLDVGCATGTKTLELATAAKHVRGIDLSAEMIKVALKKKNVANNMNCTFSQGTVFNDDLEPASFDKIISFSVIHLLEDYEDQIRRMHELLKPGGVFISATACFNEKMDLGNRLNFRFTLFMKRLGIFPLHLNMFTKVDVERLIEALDFQIIEAETVFSGLTVCFIIAGKP